MWTASIPAAAAGATSLSKRSPTYATSAAGGRRPPAARSKKRGDGLLGPELVPSDAAQSTSSPKCSTNRLELAAHVAGEAHEVAVRAQPAQAGRRRRRRRRRLEAIPTPSASGRSTPSSSHACQCWLAPSRRSRRARPRRTCGSMPARAASAAHMRASLTSVSPTSKKTAPIISSSSSSSSSRSSSSIGSGGDTPEPGRDEREILAVGDLEQPPVALDDGDAAAAGLDQRRAVARVVGRLAQRVAQRRREEGLRRLDEPDAVARQRLLHPAARDALHRVGGHDAGDGAVPAVVQRRCSTRPTTLSERSGRAAS